MRLKAILSGLFCMLTLLLLAGCGNSTSNSGSTNDKVVEIEYWHVASDSFGGQTVRELVADFNKTHPNIKVTEKFNPDMYKGLTQNLQAALASGQTPDVVQMGWNFLNYAHENFETESIDKIFADAGDPNFIKDTLNLILLVWLKQILVIRLVFLTPYLYRFYTIIRTSSRQPA